MEADRKNGQEANPEQQSGQHDAPADRLDEGHAGQYED
jgi:hypothetical protein